MNTRQLAVQVLLHSLCTEMRATTEFSGRQLLGGLCYQKEKHIRRKGYNRNRTEMMPLPFKTKKACVKVSFSFYHGC